MIFCMARLLKNLLLGLLIVGGSHQIMAFSLLGPSPAAGGANAALSWQTTAIGYNPLNTEIGGPLNLGEEYRWNVRVVTYAFDKSFGDYFGADGTNAVEKAIAILNALKPVSQFSADLTEFPRNSTRENLRAGAAGLLDLKSVTLHLLLEEMGLASPERFVFTLRQRFIDTANRTNYIVIQRNFDPVTLAPTRFVNGTLYSYEVREFEPGGGFPHYSDAVEVPVQVAPALVNRAVAGGLGLVGGFSIPFGGYYTGITRDDAGGLRYLYRTNNLNVERLLNDIQVAVTNTTTLTLLTNHDLATFTTRTVNTTNPPATLVALYPGLLITSTNSYLTNLTVTNITTYFTNYPAVVTPVLETNISTVIVTNFNYTFGNLVTNSAFNTNTEIYRTVAVSLAPGFTPGLGMLQTNITTTLTNYLPTREFYVRPVNLLDFQILSTQLVQVTATTNVLSSAFGDLFAFTNTSTMVAVTTLDLTLLNSRSYGTTLTPAQLTNLYPGILITHTNQRITNLLFTNYDGANVIITNAIATVFDYSYGNVQTNVMTTSPQVRTQLVEVAPTGFVGPGGELLQTNVLASGLVTSNFLSGEFTIIPTNLLGYQIVADLFTNVTEITNLVITNTTAVFTNTASPVSLRTIDLASFDDLVETNNPAQLVAAYAAAFPGQPPLLITSTNSYFTNRVTTTVSNYFLTTPYDPVFTEPQVVLVTNYTTNVVQRFIYTFGNVVTNPNPPATSGVVALVEETVTKNPYTPAFSTNLITNITTTLVTSNFLNGFIYVVPTNLFGYSITATQLVTVTNFTNNIYSYAFTNSGNRVTNSLDLVRFITNYFLAANPIQFVNPTNVGLLGPGIRQEVVRLVTNTFKAAFPIQLLTVPGSLGGGIGTNNEVITFSTNTVLAVNPIVFQAASGTQPGLRRGVDKITFQRVQFDSVLGQTFLPVTNNFSDVIVTNATNTSQIIRRISTAPDILFRAADLGLLANGGPVAVVRTSTSGWNNNNAIDGDASLAGPGVIPPQVNIDFNTVTPTFRNVTPLFLNEDTAVRFFNWGSFDGSTNAPIVYPVGSSITNLENQITGP